MATTIHLPPALLEAVDRRAAELQVSRNRYIRLALERAVEQAEGWSPAFLGALEDATRDEASHPLVDEMLTAIETGRTRKGPPILEPSLEDQ